MLFWEVALVFYVSGLCIVFFHCLTLLSSCRPHDLRLLNCGRLPDFYASANVGVLNLSLLPLILRTPHDQQTQPLIFTAHVLYPSMPLPLSVSLRNIDLTLDWGFVLRMVIIEASERKQRRKTSREWGNECLLCDFMLDWERTCDFSFLSLTICQLLGRVCIIPLWDPTQDSKFWGFSWTLTFIVHSKMIIYSLFQPFFLWNLCTDFFFPFSQNEGSKWIQISRDFQWQFSIYQSMLKNAALILPNYIRRLYFEYVTYQWRLKSSNRVWSWCSPPF